MNTFKRYWQQLSLRERALVLGGGGLAVACLFYYILWLPWRQQAAQWQRTIADEKSTIERMLQLAPRIRQQDTRPLSARDENLSVSAVVTQSAAAQGASITRIQPQGQQLAITLEPGDFNGFMHWLITLEQQHRIHITALEVAAYRDKPGWVAVNKLTLERKDEP